MENGAQFDLNDGLRRWRETFLKLGARWPVLGALIGLTLIPIVLLLRLAAWHRPKIGGSTLLTAVAVTGLLLATGCGQSPATKTADSTRPAGGQTPLEKALSLWAAGNQDDAVEAFLNVDLSQPRLFTKGSVLSYSETEFAALPQAAREQMAKQMMADLSSLKGLCRRVKDVGNEARSKGDTAKANQCSRQLKQCGERLDQPSSLQILRLVAKAITKLGAP